MNDPCEDICDALVSWANALSAAGTLGFAFTATKPADPNAQLELEHNDLQVMFIPFAEEEEKKGRGGEVLEVFHVSMLVIRKLSSEFPRERLSKLVRTLRAAARGVRMAGYVYSLSETVTKFDPEQVQERQQFASVVRLSYRGMS